MMKTKPSREKVESLLELIEEEGWMVNSYDAEVDPYTIETPCVMIRAEYVGDHE